MKGGVVWYVSDHATSVHRLLEACGAVSITLAHHTTGRITYLDDREGHEGDQVEVDERELVQLLRLRLANGGKLAFELWTDPLNDLVCMASSVASWDAYCFWFSLDGFTSLEGVDVARRLFRARTRLDDITVLWLEDRVGMTVGFGPAHLWAGSHVPGWPVPSVDR